VTSVPLALQATKWEKQSSFPDMQKQPAGNLDCCFYVLSAMNFLSSERDCTYTAEQIESFFRPMCTLEVWYQQLRPL
jgi:hypothetical protein